MSINFLAYVFLTSLTALHDRVFTLADDPQTESFCFKRHCIQYTYCTAMRQDDVWYESTIKKRWFVYALHFFFKNTTSTRNFQRPVWASYCIRVPTKFQRKLRHYKRRQKMTKRRSQLGIRNIGFKPRPDNWLFFLRSHRFSSVLPDKCRNTTSNQVTTASSTTLPNSQYTDLSLFGRCMDIRGASRK